MRPDITRDAANATVTERRRQCHVVGGTRPRPATDGGLRHVADYGVAIINLCRNFCAQILKICFISKGEVLHGARYHLFYFHITSIQY